MGNQKQVIIGSCGYDDIFKGRNIFVNTVSMKPGPGFDYAIVSQNQDGKDMLELVYEDKWVENKTLPDLPAVRNFIGGRKEGAKTLATYVNVSAGTTINRNTGEEVLVIRLTERPSSDHKINFIACSQNLTNILLRAQQKSKI